MVRREGGLWKSEGVSLKGEEGDGGLFSPSFLAGKILYPGRAFF